MDDKKDTPATSLREIKDIVSFSTLVESIFKDVDGVDRQRLLLLKKVIRIVEGLYLVSEGFPDLERLRTEIRSEGLKLIDVSFSYVFEESAWQESRCAQSLARLGWLVHIAFVSGYLSQTSTELLQNALLDMRMKCKGVQNTLSDGFFIDQSSTTNAARRSTSYTGRRVQGTSTELKRESGSKNIERREAILTFIKRNPKVNVKDVQAVIPEVSEKTVQRELIALVDEGVLKKEGERRWTQYSLA